MRKSNLNPLILISILIYILACFMPAYVEARNLSIWLTPVETEYLDYPGFACLLSGIFLPLALMAGYWGTAVWLANAYYFGALFMLFCHIKKRWTIILCVLLSIAIGSTLMLFTLRYADRNYFCWIESLLSGYYLWLLSFMTLLVGLLVDYLPQTTKWWSSLIYSIGLIPVCTYIIVFTLDKGDNSICFDEENQSLVSNKSLDALVIDDGTHTSFLKRIAGNDSVVALKDIYFSFTPTENDTTPIKLLSNNTYEIYNTTYVRVPKQKIRIEICSDGRAKSVEMPNEEGDNSFYYDQESQCLVTASYFSSLVIESDNRLYWLDSKGLKRNIVPINNLNIYFSESNDSILPLKANHTYIINNRSHGDMDLCRIKIHINENEVVDSISYLPPKEYI